MKYDCKMKTIDGVALTPIESQIIEILIIAKGTLTKAEQLCKTINDNYYKTAINSYETTPNAIRKRICDINKKTNNLIKNRSRLGYYIEDL